VDHSLVLLPDRLRVFGVHSDSRSVRAPKGCHMSETGTAPFNLRGHVALITGGNHGIGAATARQLASCGARVLVSYLRINDPPDPGIEQRYRENRASDANHVVDAILATGGEAAAVEADLADANTAARLFDIAENKLGSVDILINNASGWLADTFTVETR